MSVPTVWAKDDDKSSFGRNRTYSIGRAVRAPIMDIESPAKP